MIPIRLAFQPGIPLFEQVVYAARKAIVSGQMRPGEAFPSVRTLSRDLKINPNTAHKVVTHLLNEGLLEVRPGIGTVVAEPKEATRAQLNHLVDHRLEQVVVEARKLGLSLDDLVDGVTRHWQALDGGKPPSTEGGSES